MENSSLYSSCPFSWTPLREADHHSCIYLLRIMPKLRGANRNVKIRTGTFLFPISALAPIFQASSRKGTLRIPSLCWTHLSVASKIKIIGVNSLLYLKITEEMVEPIRCPPDSWPSSLLVESHLESLNWQSSEFRRLSHHLAGLQNKTPDVKKL